MSARKAGQKAVRRYTRHALHNALALASIGIHVFPLGLKPNHATETGWKLDKVYFKGLAWGTEATTKPKKIRKMFAEHPDAAVGIATGPSRLSVIDVDEENPDVGDLDPAAFTYPTARGGHHHLFATPAGMDVKSQQPIRDIDDEAYPGVDIKAWGGMVVFYFDRPLTDDDLAAIKASPSLPGRWAVPQGSASKSSKAAASALEGDVQDWIDALDGSDKYSATLRELVQAIPTADLSNGDMNAYFGPLVRAAWGSKGGRTAIEDGIDRYADGYPSKYRRAAMHSVETVVRDHAAELASKVTFEMGTKAAKAKKKPKREKKAKAQAKKPKAKKHRALRHDEYEPRGTIGATAAPTSPLEIAHQILDEHVLPPLVYWREQWYIYEQRWTAAETVVVENVLYAALRDAYWIKNSGPSGTTIPWAPTIGKVREVLRSIASLVTVPAHREAPFWLSQRDSTERLVAFEDGLVDPRTGDVQPRSWRYFTLTHIAARMSGEARQPVRWMRFLEEVFADPASRDLLQEWMGYLVSGDVRRHKGLMMIGKRRSGKGTILAICEALVGGETGSFATSMPALTEPFGLEGAIGKSLLTIGDLRASAREAASATQKLLEIIGGDSLYVNRKGRSAVTTKLASRVMVASNSMPRLYDDAAVIESRFLLLRMTRSFAGHEDLDLLEDLLAELDGIMRWAMDGYRRLEQAGSFTVPETDHEDRSELRTNSAPISEFIEDACIPTDGPGVTRTDAWSAYVNWCGEAGAAQMEQGDFSRAMAGAGYPSHRPRATEGDEVRGKWRYRGIKLRNAETANEKALRLWGSAHSDIVTTVD